MRSTHFEPEGEEDTHRRKGGKMDDLDQFYSDWNYHKMDCTQCGGTLIKNLQEGRPMHGHYDEFCPEWAAKWKAMHSVVKG